MEVIDSAGQITDFETLKLANKANASNSTGASSFIGGGINVSNKNIIVSAAATGDLDYLNTNKLKTVRHFGGIDTNANGFVSVGSGLWSKAGSGVTSDAINSILLYPSVGAFQQYSTFSLYGVK